MPFPKPEPEPTPAVVWARLLKRTLGVDGLDCPSCHAQMLVIALITKAEVVQKILDHLRLPATPPPVAPPRQHPADAQADLLHFNQDQTPEPHQAASAGSSSYQSARAARAPPRA